MSQSPVPLNYRGPAEPDPQRTRQRTIRFNLGLVGGGAVSLIVWLIAFRIASAQHGYDGLGVLFGFGVTLFALKLIAAIVFLCIRNWRSLGVGILLSLVLGLIIFGGNCAYHR
jgi:hypothetical protein